MSSLQEELDALGGDLTTALEDIAVAAILVDPDGVIRWQNQASREARGDRLGCRVEELVAADDVERLQAALKSILCDGAPAEFTIRVRDGSGGFVPLDISSAPVRDGGSVVGLFGLLARPVGETRKGPSPSPESAPELTPRQLEVLQLLAQGQSTQQIATTLSLSPTTVRNYIAQVLAALGVHTRLQAVVEAGRRGLINS